MKYDEEFEKDFERILAAKGLQALPGPTKELMREAWQHGWSAGFGWQGEIEKRMIEPHE